MKETRKKITLSSGATCTVRKMSGLDLTPLGFIPQAFPELEARRKRGEDLPPTPAERQQHFMMTKIGLCSCVSPITFPDKRRLRIVDKDTDQTAADEITIGELDQTDAIEIIAAINSFSGLTKEAGRDVAAFPEEQKSNAPALPDGGEVREAANGVAAPSAG